MYSWKSNNYKESNREKSVPELAFLVDSGHSYHSVPGSPGRSGSEGQLGNLNNSLAAGIIESHLWYINVIDYSPFSFSLLSKTKSGRKDA